MTEPTSSETPGAVDPAAMRRALTALRELRIRAERAERALREPIAIVGIGCRFPGGVVDPESYWSLLETGRDAIVETPPDRWSSELFYDPDPEAPGRLYARHGGFLADPIDRFDAPFFGISPRETLSLDPQQRLLLETAWEALEHAGIPPGSLGGSDTGVYVGISTTDFAVLGDRYADPARVDPYSGTGSAYCTAAGRISYSLGLNGPNLALDTACSSSLVASILAVQALRSGACSLALAAGVNLMLSPFTTVYMCKLRALSFAGRCRTFDAGADGYVRGEGCGVLVLKRLSDAIRDDDRVVAVIRGVAYNHDGRSGGLTVPNGAAQRAVIEAALRDAGVSPAEVQYVEAHGTGTPLGDPIEIRALAEALGPGRQSPLQVGSVKTNIGHLEAAAGVAAIAKTALAVNRGVIPAHLHFDSPNPHLDWDALPVEVTGSRRPWPAAERRIAGVSAFGISGTNAHLIIEEPPAREAVVASPYPIQIVTASGLDDAAAARMARRLADRIERGDGSLAEVAATAAVGRTHFAARLAAVGDTAEDVAHSLRQAADERDATAGKTRSRTSAPRLAYLFTGQGAQYSGMGSGLYRGLPLFRDAVDRCLALVDPPLADRLRSVLADSSPDDPAVHRTSLAQPALFVLGYALADVLGRLGVRPVAMIGHSIGELTAACRAGALTLGDALRLVSERGRLMESAPGTGAMLSIVADESVAAAICAEFGFDHAAANGPSSHVVAGEAEAVELAKAALASRGVPARQLTVSHAFHSRQMDSILDPFTRVADAVSYGEPAIPVISNRTAAPLTRAQLTGKYWRDHLRGTVRFGPGLEALAAMGVDGIVELGPHPVLLGMGGGDWPADRRIPTLRRGRDDWRSFAECLAALFRGGVDLDWKRLLGPQKVGRVSIPTYPFERIRYWPEGRTPRPAGQALVPGGSDQVGGSLYHLQWQAAGPGSMSRLPGRLVVVSDGGTLGSGLAAALREAGRTVTEVPFAGLDSETDGTVTRAADAVGAGDDPPGIVCIGPTAPDGFALSERVALGERWLAMVLRLVVALGDRNARLWLVTCGATGAGGSVAAPEAAMTSGFGSVIASERPRLGCVGIDLDAADVSPIAELLELLGSDPSEPEIAVRGGKRLVPRLASVSPSVPPIGRLPVRADATYLVTGGLGGLGLTVASALVADGARHLVLSSRGRPGAAAEAAIAEMTARGASVALLRADVGDWGVFSVAAAECLEALPPLRGVIHAAGVLEDGLIGSQDWSAFEKVLGPKVRGTLNLHRLAGDRQLDFFVLFSSVASIFGPPGQGNYSAANRFLDAFAGWRRAAGMPALAIQWGSWSDVGMAATLAEQHRRRWAAMGIGVITPAEGIAALRTLLGADVGPAVAVLPLDASRLQGRVPPVLSALAGSRDAAPDVSLRDRLIAAEPSERPPLIADFLRDQLRRTMAIDSERFQPGTSLLDLGLDSLMAIELRNAFESKLGISVPVARFLEGPTVSQLEALVLSELGASIAAADSDRDLLARIDTLSEEDLDAHLRRMLAAEGD